MDLQELRVNTIFKLKTMNLDEEDKICDRVMKGNNKTIKKIIYQYIRNSTSRKSNKYFYDNFTKKSSIKFLKKLDVEQIKRIISVELDNVLKHSFRNNSENKKFQEIVDKAIECTQHCSYEPVHKNIPQWIHINYKIVDGDVVEDSHTNKIILETNKQFEEEAQDIFELVDHLTYVENLKTKINKYLRPEEMNGIVDAFEYAEYLKETRVNKEQLIDELNKQKRRIKEFLEIANIPESIKKEVIMNNYAIKTKRSKMYIKTVRKQYEQFILFQKYGDIKDTFWREKKGALKLVRSPNIILDYSEENPAINLGSLLLNSVIVSKRKFQSFYNKLDKNNYTKIIKVGDFRGNKYIVYDYVAPKKWFKDSFFNEVLQKIDEVDLSLDEEIEIEYCFPYTSYWGIQQRFTTNFMIFMNKIGITGLSERRIERSKEEMEKESHFAAINSYQIYYPQPRNITHKQNVTREQKKKQYYNLYSCFHHELKHTKKGNLKSGGNIVRKCMYETGDLDLDFFIADIDARHFFLENYILLDDPNEKRGLFGLFFEDVKSFYKQSHEVNKLYSFLNRCKRKYLNELCRKLVKYTDYFDLEKELTKYHGNSKKAKQIKRKMKLFNLPSEEMILEIKQKARDMRHLKKELKGNGPKENYMLFRNIILEAVDRYCEVKYYRKIRVSRNVVSLAKLMTNNLNIKGVVRSYKTRSDEWLHKFSHQYKDDELELEEKLVNTTQLIKLLLEMSIKIKDKKIFDLIFDLLWQAKLENKEKKLLEDFAGY